ncbi:hypothetical protein KL86DES1_20799 [uncultured Desulfovibrio sp.]|uniref:Uncharacterized protein n=1 Tax=uncultured Desulfovibrio sp. TaxID=167968 RepID=A0A212L587_9BACT|nr:hypothetical protein KL86DES1_20799 [uncultured Desulfovibrio sp.]VZH33700.1 conserved protein of unknown function [Desulfovibrio sp. 86]
MGRALRLTTVPTDMRAMVEMATGFRLAGMQAPGKRFGVDRLEGCPQALARVLKRNNSN